MVKSRIRNAAIICIMWVAIMVAAAAYATDRDLMDPVMIFMMMTISGVLEIIAIAIYLGSYENLAGYNTMTEEQRKQYDMEKITGFMCISVTVISITSFLMYLIMVNAYGILTSMLVTVTTVTVLLIIVAAYTGTKRFRANDACQ